MPRFSCLCSILFLFVLIQHQTRGVETADTCSNQEIEDGTCQQSSSTKPKTNGQRKQSQNKKGNGSSSVWKIPPDVLGRSQEAAEKGQMGHGTRIISNLINDPRILKHLTDHREWFSCYEDTRDSRTYWYDKNDEPNSIWEYLATVMWKDQPFLQAEDFAGFEIWCNVLTPEGPLTWHVDKDQVKYQKSGGKELSLPLYGSVFYGYPHEFKGGYLELLKYDTNSWPEGMDEPDPESVERIEAEYNRLVVFNASKFHRVSPIYSGARVTLAVNVWKERPGVH
jgi:hypothetical protein